MRRKKQNKTWATSYAGASPHLQAVRVHPSLHPSRRYQVAQKGFHPAVLPEARGDLGGLEVPEPPVKNKTTNDIFLMRGIVFLMIVF